MTTVRKEPRRVRRARRAAAFHAHNVDRARTPTARLQAVESELTAAAKHSRRRGVAREVRDDVAGHVAEVLDRAQVTGARRRLYDTKMQQPGTDVARLATALWCLRAAIALTTDTTERDRLYEHYIRDLRVETHRLNAGRSGS